ncbi:hypothetical protein ACVWYW_000702 [Ewingella americana]
MPRRLERFCTKASGRFLVNLGLTEHLIPVGVPLPWPTATPPAGWLKCNGVAFDKAKYPQLATAYPSGVLPDLRGEFIRGWDDERGVDIGRALYSAQKATSFRTAALDYFGSDETTTGGTVGTAFASPDSVTFEQPAEARSPANTTLINIMADNSIKAEQLPVGLTTQHSIWVSMRPRSIAFNYIVRAA